MSLYAILLTLWSAVVVNAADLSSLLSYQCRLESQGFTNWDGTIFAQTDVRALELFLSSKNVRRVGNKFEFCPNELCYEIVSASCKPSTRF